MPISYDRPNKCWRYHFDRYIAGSRHRASQLLPKGWSRAQADTFDRQETARLYAIATGVSKPEPLIDEAVLLYLKYRAPSLKSFRNIERELNACADIYTGKPFSSLPEIARDYSPATEDGRPLKPATVKNRLSYIRAACRYAWKIHGKGEHDPAERMEMPKVRNERHVYLDRPQVLQILRKMKPGAERAAVRIAFYSGMRAGELRQATTIRTASGPAFMLQPDATKNEMPRVVPVHPRIQHILRNAALWPMPRTKWTVSIKFKKAAIAAGFGHARLHDMRHSTASEMINGGADLFTVGGVLGHKSAVSTRRYAHLVTGTLAVAVNMVGNSKRPPAVVEKSRTTPKKKAA